MAPTQNIFWCRVYFQAYIKHYRKMTDEQIVKDVRQSMDDLEDLVSDTDTFGSQMIRWALERADEPFATAARENGKKGGRPRKNPQDAPNGNAGDANLVHPAPIAESARCATSEAVKALADASTREGEDERDHRGNTGILESSSSAKNFALDSRTDKDRQPNEDRQSRRTGAEPRGVSHGAPVRLPSFDEFTRFVDQQGLDYTDAREWWEMTMVDRDGKDRDGKPIANWKGALKRFCTTKTANRRSA